MYSTIDDWLDDLATLTDEVRASQQFQDWLGVQSRSHDYSHCNALLISLQCPEATKVAGYNVWQSEFDRPGGRTSDLDLGADLTICCSECHNSPSYHDRSDCRYDETPPDEWSRGLVGFKPTAVFDVSQTGG